MASAKRCAPPTPLGIAAAEADRLDAALQRSLDRVWRLPEHSARYEWARAEVRRLQRDLRGVLQLVATLRTSEELAPWATPEPVKDGAATAQRRRRRP
jgi:hypothetical protein